MRNPFKKSIAEPRQQQSILYSLRNIIDKYFPIVNKDAKSELIKAGTGFAYALSNIIANDCALTQINLFTRKKTSRMKTRTLDYETKAYMSDPRRSGLGRISKSIDNIEEVLEHPLLDLLDSMNNYDNGFDVMATTEKHQLLVGDAYWWVISATEASGPTLIHLMQPENMTIETDKELFRIITGYKYNSIKQILLPKEIIHFRYSNATDWLYGYSPLQAAMGFHNVSNNLTNLLTDLSTNRNGMDIYMKTPVDARNYSPDQKKAIKEQIGNFRSGNIKADEIMIIDKDGELLAIPNANKDLPFIENLKGLFRFMCWIYGIPESIFNTESSNRAVQGTTTKWYYQNTIQTKNIRTQATLNEKFVPMFQDAKDEGLFLMFQDAVPVDVELLIKEVAGGITTPNEARKKRKQDAVDGFDSLYIPSGVQVPADNKQSTEEQVRAILGQVIAEVKQGMRS